MANNHKRPKVTKRPTAKKEAKAKSEELDRQENETIAWRFSIADLDGPWGWKTKAGKHWWSRIFPKLQNLESMTWVEITQASGAKTHGNNSHSVPVARLGKAAKDRLREIDQEDLSDLFSLRLDGPARIFGVREGRALKLLWYDHNHTVYPVNKK